MQIRPVEITKIPSNLRETYLSHTKPQIETIICLEAYEEKPLGFVIASLMTKALSAEILYLSKDHSSELLNALEAILREKKCYLVCMNYPAENAETLENTLKKLNWGAPFPLFERYYFDTTLFPKDWFKHPFKWPEGFSEFLWNELTEEEMTRIKIREEKGSFPISVTPFGEEERIEPINSLGLRHEGEVIGWMITHRLNPDTIRYTALYIHPRYHFSGYPIKLLADSINLQLEHHVKWGIFDLNAKQTGPNWVKFIKKRLAPLAQRIVNFNRTWKDLTEM